MTRHARAFAAVTLVPGALLAALAAPAWSLASSPSAGPSVGASPYVVVYKPGSRAPSVLTPGLGRRLGFHPTFVYGAAPRGFAARLTPAQADRLGADPDVAFLEADRVVTAAGLTPLLSGETEPVGMLRIGAASPSLGVHAASGVAVAVLDTGIDLANGDLNAVNGTNCIKSGSPAQDDNGHGTNVAGIIAARNQGAGVVGVAPGTKLYSVKVLGSTGSGTLSQVLCGINWVTANAGSLGIKVANMSLTAGGANDNNCGASNKDAEHQAICSSVKAGVTYVAAAGNNNTSLAKYVPAAYPEVLTVTAMTDTDGVPGGLGPKPCISGQKDDSYGTYSNFATSTSTVDVGHTIAAPGTCILSDNPGGGTSTYYGTSQAAPHVAGTVAECLDDGGVAGPCSGLAPAQIIAKVRGAALAAATSANGFTGDPLHPLSGHYYGYLVNDTTY